MSKYDFIRFLKKTEARVYHECDKCKKAINPGDFYYAERLKDSFLHTMHNKKFCGDCYKECGDNLLKH